MTTFSQRPIDGGPEVPVIPGEPFGGSGDATHLYCCDPHVGLCGKPLWGEDLGYGSGQATDCFPCVAVDHAGVPCHARFCRLRRWWRGRRSR